MVIEYSTGKDNGLKFLETSFFRDSARVDILLDEGTHFSINDSFCNLIAVFNGLKQRYRNRSRDVTPDLRTAILKKLVTK